MKIAYHATIIASFFSLPVGNSSQYVLYAIVGSFENELSLVIKFALSFVV